MNLCFTEVLIVRFQLVLIYQFDLTGIETVLLKTSDKIRKIHELQITTFTFYCVTVY